MRQGFRQSMAWLHSWSGLILGWLLFAIALTGTASVFKPEIGDWMRPELSAPRDPVRSLSAAIRYLARAAPDATSWYLTAPDDRTASPIAGYAAKDADGVDRYRLIALDAATGSPAGIRDTLGGEFFYRFHFQLQLPYPWGRILASAAAMLMLVALISGIITHRRIFADLFTLRPGKGKRSWLDAHNVLGVLALPFHLMISFTGVLTLATLTLPWAGIANYGSDSAALYADASPGFTNRPRAGKPASLGDIAAMLADARRRFGGGRIGAVSVENPGDSAAVLLVSRHDGDQMAYAPSRLSYDAVTGRLLASYVERRPAMTSFNLLYGLHMGRFAPQFSRWLYFLCGLALAGTIATGMVLWTASRADGRGFGHRLIERLTVGAIGGLPLAMAAWFLANRLIPAGVTDRRDIEVNAFFLTWGAGLLFGLIRMPRRGWIELTGATAGAWLAVPILSAITVGRLFPAFDLVALALGTFAAMIMAKLVRYRPPEPRRRRAA